MICSDSIRTGRGRTAAPGYDLILTAAPEAAAHEPGPEPFDLVLRLVDHFEQPTVRAARQFSLVRAVVAGVFVSLLAYTLCHEHGRGILAGKLSEHVAAGALYAGYVLYVRAGRRGRSPSVEVVEKEVSHELRQAVVEGVLFGTATALFHVFLDP